MKVWKVSNIIGHLEKVKENSEKALEEIQIGIEEKEEKSPQIDRLKDEIGILKVKSDWLIDKLQNADFNPECINIEAKQ